MVCIILFKILTLKILQYICILNLSQGCNIKTKVQNCRKHIWPISIFNKVSFWQSSVRQTEPTPSRNLSFGNVYIFSHFQMQSCWRRSTRSRLQLRRRLSSRRLWCPSGWPQSVRRLMFQSLWVQIRHRILDGHFFT